MCVQSYLISAWAKCKKLEMFCSGENKCEKTRKIHLREVEHVSNFL